MDKCWSTVCALMVIFSTARTADPPRIFCPRHLPLPPWRKGCDDCPGDHICCVHGGDICIPLVSTKPGMCPSKPSDIGICIVTCFSDTDCPDNEKCCSNGCGHTCMAAVTAKPGKCPSKPWDIGICVVTCFSDTDCPDNEKCCSNGCGHTCMAAVTEYCPWHRPLPPWHKGCEDCPRDHKCCVYDGEKFCVLPVSTKPGFCPHRHFDIGLCKEDCSRDSDCPDNNKCCFNGCGYDCKAPAID